MANRKRSSRRQQPQHKNNRKKSQHDKRRRLDRHNLNRKKTSQAKVPLSGAMHNVALMLRAVLVGQANGVSPLNYYCRNAFESADDRAGRIDLLGRQ